MTENASYEKIVDDAMAERREFYGPEDEILMGEYDAMEISLAEEAYEDYLREREAWDAYYEGDYYNDDGATDLYDAEQRVGYYDPAWDGEDEL